MAAFHITSGAHILPPLSYCGSPAFDQLNADANKLLKLVFILLVNVDQFFRSYDFAHARCDPKI